MMPNPVRKLFVFLRARWRRARGRCPLCNRNLHATFANYMAAHPNCPACKDRPTTDARLWHRAAPTAAEWADAAGVGE